ncbi:hypothetical protein BDZ89DRAFT_1056773 [Hymenopellis radicata]|nr:hypothetical protein BDZ89DRAFT_1056773 [Hymenopellis radicata]
MRRVLLQKCRYLCGVTGATYATSLYSKTILGVRDPVGPGHIQQVSAVLPGGRVWSFSCLVDNHHGHHTSGWLAKHFIPAAVGKIAALFSKTKPSSDTPASSSTFRTIDDSITSPANPTPLGEFPDEEINDELKDLFLTVDDDIINLGAMLAMANKRRRKLPWKAADGAGNEDSTPHGAPNVLQPALSGSSLTLTFFDSKTHTLHVATTGDIRAIFGRSRGDQGGYDVQLLGQKQLDADARRVEQEHPGETSLVDRKGTLFGGVSPLRVFGMAPLKWTKEVKEKIGMDPAEYYGAVEGKVLTPPYLTAEPIVTSIQVQEGDVLVMASSALFSTPKPPPIQDVFNLVDTALHSTEQPSRRRVTGRINSVDENVPTELRFSGRAVNSSIGIFDTIERTWKNIFLSDDQNGWFEDRNLATKVVEGLHGEKEEIPRGVALSVAVLIFGKMN